MPTQNRAQKSCRSNEQNFAQREQTNLDRDAGTERLSAVLRIMRSRQQRNSQLSKKRLNSSFYTGQPGRE
eukprot:6115574-Amphidinium_carterae.1